MTNLPILLAYSSRILVQLLCCNDSDIVPGRKVDSALYSSIFCGFSLTKIGRFSCHYRQKSTKCRSIFAKPQNLYFEK
ncbi:MAG: hypothetical protein BECKG1743D_GA0114223_102973 [Candidatus Kentron sp. G]|nr:MAG: hypothetical protein BECKG1743F_GA0114225_101422 [Candidatus Kentron sp. G]VFM98257.1 MAG: hypothetical protein BECKG1743E_GA0114224_101787 [Candidatus Kentron sp. G]VFN01637.1 MAG: hypothetical protein BECKG1743D_GA0114223_102973 [Candidatus Kentron sp. G]